jgi:phage baseplate assembly protein W
MSWPGMNASTGRTLDEASHIRQSVRDILTTPIGSRLARRDYGSMLPELIDQPQNGATRMRALSATAMALIRWEPRIAITRLSQATDSAGRQAIEIEADRIDGPRGPQPLSLNVIIKGERL